ncbi:UNVERIFIED_CONTAM: hypothetical protein Sangu_2838500 [Sesamum angustifolium]|uniref:Protein LOW PSII ACCUMULATION 1, chloroplastic n=1 Tax=Sesamum angustifolium TaxID=2727405 RepID=A0AAW2IPW7_9LAMI
MAAVAWLSTVIIDCPSCNRAVKRLGFSRQINGLRYNFAVAGVNSARRRKSRASTTITCFASNGPSPSEISSTAKIRSEVLSPFRSVRMFFYLAFVASGSLGGFIAFTQLLGALANSSRAADVPEILKGLGIDLAAVSVFVFLYYRENNAKNAQVARLSREESLSNLKLCVDEKRILSLSAFRGIARLVILAGPAAFIEESFKLSQPFSEGLLERGCLLYHLLRMEILLPLSSKKQKRELRLMLKGKGYGSWLLFMLLSGPIYTKYLLERPYNFGTEPVGTRP